MFVSVSVSTCSVGSTLLDMPVDSMEMGALSLQTTDKHSIEMDAL